MGRPAETEILDVTNDEIAAIRQAIKESTFAERHKAVLLTLIDHIVTICKTKREKEVELNKIKRVLKNGSEKRSPDEKNAPDVQPPKKTKNHGRRAAKEYKTRQTIRHSHKELKAGQTCPDCAHGTLQDTKPRRFIRLVGNPSIVADLHEVAGLRCGGCGKTFSAELPPEIGEEKADASANAVVATFRYAMGIPHYRLATIQEVMGVPLPPSTQYEMVEMLWSQTAPVFKELLRQAAEWPLIFADDTPAKVLEFMKDKEARKANGERVGIFTTALVARNEGKEIHLFFTGRKHAGENLAELLKHRDKTQPPPIHMSDALSRNQPKDHLTIVALCLVHGRRNFIDCESAFPDEAAYVIERIAKVYQNERHIWKAGMNDQQRLEYHQKHSQEPMDEIKAYAAMKLAHKEVEPNSSLGDAFQYMLKYWEGMTQFLKVPGAPLDNNAAERLVKRSIMHRKNSLFYKTENGARVGDCLMSLIQTCMAAKENPIDYLTVLQRNSRHAAKNPHLWLPWNYRNTLKSIAQPP